MINIFNGFESPQEGIGAIGDAQKLLQNCTGFTSDQMWYVYSAKEKLSRLNNNIGGLGEVDQDLGIPVNVADGDTNVNADDETNPLSQTALVVAVVVPIVTVVIVAALVAIGCFMVKRRQEKEKRYGEMHDATEESEDGDDDDALVPPTPTPLNLPRVAERARAGEDEDSDDSTGEDS